MDDWNEPRLVLAVARAGSLTQAAKALGIDHSTVFRRLNALEERGILFIAGGEKLYQGMIIGENAKPQDLEVNPLKSKQLTNFRSTGKDDAVRLTPPRRMSLEQAIAYIEDDELVEVTPQSIRLRKRYLDPHERKKASRKDAAA